MASTYEFRPVRLLKRDLMGTVESGVLYGEGRAPLQAVRRSWTSTRLWARPVAWVLAGRERHALLQLSGQEGVPALVAFGRGELLRAFLEGRTLDEAAPPEARFYADARRLLRSIHHRGVTHNDTHKEQNWLVTTSGAPALVDFQLAGCHDARGAWFRLCRAEDVRHLLKHKRTHCASGLTARERRLLARKSWPARAWAALVKPVYRFMTRRLLRWSDREGRG